MTIIVCKCKECETFEMICSSCKISEFRLDGIDFQLVCNKCDEINLITEVARCDSNFVCKNCQKILHPESAVE